MKQNTKVIIVTGGVYSSLGKGIIASSLGRLLTETGFSVSILKFDPYLNINPSQLNPKEHGEVFITKDGCQTDLDIGNYERFVGSDMNKYSSVCSGKIFQEIINDQIENKYNGETIQVIPHITNKIRDKIYDNINNNKPDFLIIEIGGTVGDIESIPFFESINRFAYEYGKQNVLFAHCVPLLKISSVSGEIKTKPAQHSIQNLRSLGIVPEILFTRSEEQLPESTIDKLSNLVLIPKTNIFNAFNVSSTYFLVNELYNQNLHKKVLEYFGMSTKKDISNWLKFTDSIKKSQESKVVKNILIMGGYTSLRDAYFSVIESLLLASYKYSVKLNISWMDINDINESNISQIEQYDGIINGGYKEIDAKVNKTVFDYFQKTKKTILNYNIGFFNLMEYIFNDYSKYIDVNENKVGVNKCVLIDSKLIELKKDYLVRRSSPNCLDKKIFDDNKEKDFSVCSVYDNKYVDMVISNKNKHFISMSSNPEFCSKPENVNIFYDVFFKMILK